MSMKFTQLQCKEVICIKDGRRLGFVEDVLVEVPEGTVCALVVPGPCRYFGVVGRGDDFVIPWKCICHIGPDIVLVDTKPDDCRHAAAEIACGAVGVFVKSHFWI